MRKIFLVFLFIIPDVFHTAAQVIVSRPFPFTRQLYTNEVYDIYQDLEGFVWLGTTKGLHRWDGHRLLTFRCDGYNPHLLAGSHVRQLIDTKELLWISFNPYGLSLYDKRTGRFFLPSDERLRDQLVSGFALDSDGSIWLAVNSRLYHCNSNCTSVEEINPFRSLDREYGFFDIYMDSKDSLWVMCLDGIILRGKDDHFHQLPSTPNNATICTMFEDAQGHFWMGTWGAGLWQCFPHGNGPKGYWLEHNITQHDRQTPERNIFCIRQDREMGWLWMLSYDELYAFRYDDDGQLQPIELPAYIDQQRYYTKISIDREGILWLAAYDQGSTLCFDLTGTRNFHVPQLVRDQHLELDLMNLCADGSYVWLNQERKGLQLYDRATDRLVNLYAPSRPELATLIAGRAPGTVWAAGRTTSTVTHMVHHDMDVTVTMELDLNREIPGTGLVTRLAEDRNGILWILTQSNLFALPSLTPSPPHGNPLPPVTVPEGSPEGPPSPSPLLVADLNGAGAITLNRDETSVLCATDSQLYDCSIRQRHVTCRPLAQLDFLHAGERVRIMAVDTEQKVWMVTTLGRTFRSDSLLQHFAPSPVDSLVQDGILQDMLAQDSALWIMTDKHLICYDVAHSTSRVYNAGEGIVEVMGFRHQALCRDSDGILAGGYGGFIHLPLSSSHPYHALGSAASLCEEPSTLNPQPSPLLTDVLVNGHSLFFNHSDDGNSTFTDIVLPPDARNIELHFSTLTYFPGATPRMQYILQEADTEWSDADPLNPVAFYSRLPRGTYNLLLRIQQQDGTWSQPFEIATVQRQPHWYETVWAFIIYAILIALFLAQIAWYIRRRQARELHTEVTQAKVAIITADHKFTDEMVKIIDRHLDDTDFRLEHLVKEMGMSKSSLYRQLRTEADMTPNDFIRSIRLKRACEMLLTTKMNVSEVAYATGFSTPKYFTRCFKDEFNQTPTEYVRSHQTTGVPETPETTEA